MSDDNADRKFIGLLESVVTELASIREEIGNVRAELRQQREMRERHQRVNQLGGPG